MTNQSTIDKLIEMHMTPMADAFRIQMNDSSMREVPFEDRFGMLVDHEYTERKNKRLKRLIRNAEFEQPDACIAAVDYGHNRKVNRTLVERLATCEYITEYRNIFITGATGSGKTYMACAFGMEACKHFYTVKYVRVPDLLLDLRAARDEGHFSDTLKKYTNPTLLILDEWLLMRIKEDDSSNLLELIHKRRKHSCRRGQAANRQTAFDDARQTNFQAVLLAQHLSCTTQMVCPVALLFIRHRTYKELSALRKI